MSANSTRSETELEIFGRSAMSEHLLMALIYYSLFLLFLFAGNVMKIRKRIIFVEQRIDRI